MNSSVATLAKPVLRPSPKPEMDEWGLRSIANLPQNMIDYFHSYNANLQININHTDALNGYGSFLHSNIVLMRLGRKCDRPLCDYHSLFCPNEDDTSKHFCGHHRYVPIYEVVFSYEVGSEKTLEEAFQEFLDMQGRKYYDPVKPLIITRNK